MLLGAHASSVGYSALLSLALASCGRESPTGLDARAAASGVTARRHAGEGLLVPGWSERRYFDDRGKRDPDGDTMDNACEDGLAAAATTATRSSSLVDVRYDDTTRRWVTQQIFARGLQRRRPRGLGYV